MRSAKLLALLVALASSSVALAHDGQTIQVTSASGTRSIRIGRELGHGHFGAVHEAHETDGTTVVAKFMNAGPVAQHETEVLRATVGKPRLLQSLGERITEHESMLVLPYVKGAQLGTSQRIAKRERGKAIRIAMNILRGVRELHEAGYLHGDIAPQNVMIDKDVSDTTKLIDYGNAVHPGQNVSSTWEYMPPEQFASDGKMTPSSDTYATAGVLVAMLTGRSPRKTTQGNYYDGMRAEHVAGRVDFTDAEIGNPAVSAVLRKALSVRPEDRYTSAQAFIDALRPFSAR